MAHPFVELLPEYQRDLAIVQITRKPEVDAVVRRLLKLDALAQYAAVEKALRIPIVVQATICERESSSNFSRSPAQGDPWDRVSTHVPRGRGPFRSWYDAAIDAFHAVDHLDANSAPWSLPYAMWKWEGYNGFGYRAHGIRSPYVVGGTNLQQRGKYVADGVWDASAMDTQLGCLALALRMIELRPELMFGPAVAGQAPPPIVPPVGPVPGGVGGAVPGRDVFTGTKWIQDSLNRLTLPGSDQLVVDGVYGRFTRRALRAFQASVGHTADGLVDDVTLAFIDRELARLPR